MSDKIHCESFSTDALLDLADHAEAEIERWQGVLKRVLGQLATRELINQGEKNE